MQRRDFIQAGAASALGFNLGASAQTYPSRPINWIVPWAAGGSADFSARLIGAELGKVLGQSLAIENVGGGGGLVGMNKAASAIADGHTLYYGGTELFVPAMTNPKITNEWNKQFKPILSIEENQQDLINLRWIFFVLLAFLATEWAVRKYSGRV